MHSFTVDPACFDVVVVQGADAERFLQGQLTCDVASQPDGSLGYGACCNNKGRVIAAFAIIRFTDTFYLCMSKGVGSNFVAALKKFLPFYKCTLTLADENHRLIAAAGDHVGMVASAAGVTNAIAAGYASIVDDGWFCRLEGAEPRCLWWCAKGLDEVAASLGHTTQGNELESWEALALLEGHFPFHSADTELYTPQELHYDQNGYVSFSKGCYTGQEIVARMHYRGKQKKQLFLLRIRSTEATHITSVSVRDKAAADIGLSLLTRRLGLDVLALVQLPHGFAAPIEELHCPQGALLTLHAFGKK